MLNYAWPLTLGEFDLYVADPRASEWDIAAGDAILRNAGGSVKDMDGKSTVLRGFLLTKTSRERDSVPCSCNSICSAFHSTTTFLPKTVVSKNPWKASLSRQLLANHWRILLRPADNMFTFRDLTWRRSGHLAFSYEDQMWIWGGMTEHPSQVRYPILCLNFF